MNNQFDQIYIPWIGLIPENWSLVRFKDKYQNKKEIAKNNSVSFERLALTLNGVIKRSKDDSDGLQPKEFDSYQIIRSNDFVFKMIDLQNISTSRVGLSPFTGLVSPAYIRFSPRTKDSPKFAYFFLMSMYFNNVFNSLGGDGVRSSLSATDLGNLYIPWPNEKTREKIIFVLESKSKIIDSLINIQEKQIENLKAYRNRIINEAVTKGIRKQKKLNFSGNVFVGLIPENWSCKQFKYIASSIQKGSGITKEELVEDGDTFCVRYGEIYSKYQTSFYTCFSKTNAAQINSKQYFSYGDVLFAGTGELVEEIGKSIVYLGKNKCLAGGDIILAKHDQSPLFMGFALDSLYCQKQKSIGKAKLKVVHISANDIGNIYFALPPISEQKEIEIYLERKNKAIQRIIEIKKNKIELLKKYKVSLFYELTTGKKEVN